MTESTSRHKISPDDHVDTSGDADTDARFDSPATLDRGIPDLDGLRRRSIVGWLVPLAIVMLALLGAVWTVHGVLVRHDDAARARRSALDAKGTHEKVFEDAPALAELASAASAPPVRSSPPAVARAVTPVDRMAPGRSYYDAPLLAIGARDSQMDEASEGGSVGTGALPARTSGQVQDVTPGAAGSVSQPLSSPLSQALTPTHTPKVTAAFIGNRSLLLAQGTKIDCAGDAAFDSTQAGMSTCTVTRNVYSDDGRVVLIERGSQINCEYRANLGPGQRRVFVLSARIVTPHGVTVQIDSPVADALGRMGMAGSVENHWGERVGAAMLLGLSQDAIGYLATRGGNGNGTVVYQNTQAQGNDMATRVLDQTVNIAPTLKQNQGAEFMIVLARDLDFGSVYSLEPEGMR
ncbi:MAG: type IV secretion system protein VirB10 [Burkholderia sp.]|jgi:type IV secretion system protein VirB10|uniref:type IV secretion system protein VirB10 n=2 Tax=Burkholderia sp. TaxID=36773 RepID=UPI001131E403|nr:type IV secretion system protein VirB10 [Burkholderia sp.]MCA3642017.1 type IV secretion system protein VirB10 [Methylobacterium sp.]MCA3779129.1 type IV secretion system protein VirB10 [Burkholderia sp.]MCA3797151.1 type IV secretion system protein VirB10 [Burkholderia sp.]MCA3803095.1 type IV secretion system protein VirB10 [Burkholderia sp.]MCA3812099.1 type IV secretion system protein VirB10 [Burkholderia sp.]